MDRLDHPSSPHLFWSPVMKRAKVASYLSLSGFLQVFVLPMLAHLLVISAVVQVVWTRAKTVDIFNNPGKGDILQLRNLKKNDTILYNAMHTDADEKWDLTDKDGNIVIPYTITGPFDSKGKSVINKAMKRIAKNTCVRFKKWEGEVDYIDLVNDEGEGCYTSVGRIGGRSVVQLESSEEATCMVTSIVLHELMHVVGLWHEHQRYDRDKYIDVLYENIGQEFYDQFTKVSPFEATTYNVPYDYKSVMHYGKDAFALPNKISMRTKDPAYQDLIGKQHDASPSDYQKICEIYKCKKCLGKAQ